MKPSVGVAIALVAISFLPVEIAATAEPVKSGPQPGAKIETIFEPVNLNGDYPDEPHCLVCENGRNPVAMIFARDWSEPLKRLITQLDAACIKYAPQQLGSFAVFLDAPESLEEKLRVAAKQAQWKKAVLALEAEAHIPEYRTAADAEVTVVLYVRHDVRANFAFRKGELNDAAIERIVAALPQILNP